MDFVTRLATDAAGYPLPIEGPARWIKHNNRLWESEVRLPALPADEHIIVPSFCAMDDPHAGYQFSLRVDNQEYVLDPVPAVPGVSKGETTTKAEPAAISCHIDCWHSHKALAGGVVKLQVESEQAPQSYLLTVSVRPLELSTVPVLSSATFVCVDVPTDVSQMTADAKIRARICSPTALTMALSVFHEQIDWQNVVEACYDPRTNAYGAWPLAIRRAAYSGTMAAVECFSDWSQVVAILSKGSPLVCSIRFAKDQLQGAPLTQTGGHLVLLYGIDGEYVLIKDPAADSDAEVTRRYKATEFSQAWLQRRGAAYIFAVPH